MSWKALTSFTCYYKSTRKTDRSKWKVVEKGNQTIKPDSQEMLVDRSLCVISDPFIWFIHIETKCYYCYYRPDQVYWICCFSLVNSLLLPLCFRILSLPLQCPSHSFSCRPSDVRCSDANVRVDVSGGRDPTKREAEDRNLCPHPCFGSFPFPGPDFDPYNTSERRPLWHSTKKMNAIKVIVETHLDYPTRCLFSRTNVKFLIANLKAHLKEEIILLNQIQKWC